MDNAESYLEYINLKKTSNLSDIKRFAKYLLPSVSTATGGISRRTKENVYHDVVYKFANIINMNSSDVILEALDEYKKKIRI